ncbi:MAG TPA: metallophosphoesterase family protein, partial [Immundisolibacter sp.]|nr:metallophosphoesterase family protein [Immundisolibacter sp.]
MNSPAVRVLLLADTHGVLDPRIAELAQDCALAVHAGDVGASAVLETLAVAAGRVLAVRGNNDVPGKWLGPAADLLALPERIDVPLPGGTLVVEHGHRHSATRRHLRLRAAYPGARAVLYGHSHCLAQDCALAVHAGDVGASAVLETLAVAAGRVL